MTINNKISKSSEKERKSKLNKIEAFPLNLTQKRETLQKIKQLKTKIVKQKEESNSR
jgi:hypothetical protein